LPLALRAGKANAAIAREPPLRQHGAGARRRLEDDRVTEPRLPATTSDAVDAQRAYYRETAGTYDAMRECEAEHGTALALIVPYLARLGSASVLDTGCGTGRAMRAIASALPGVRVHGNDPSPELLRVATEQHGIPASALDCAGSDPLPYADGSFDAVIATGIMHHVPDPGAVVAEMLRVARQAIFISDCNIYGSGRLPVRLAKLALARVGLLRPLNRMRRGGHDWFESEGDGVVWSYSVFDSRGQIAAACAETLVIPTAPRPSAAMPMLQSTHCLVCGFKERLPDVE
jgi:SAM-dependent methyltransferase